MPLLAPVLLGSLLTSCSFLRRGDMPVDRSLDPAILEEVTLRVQAEPALAARTIRVEVDGGIVLLYGSVEGMGAWQCAIRTAQLARGVRSVVDYLVIERGPREVACLAHRAH